jgi:hypothetical protein
LGICAALLVLPLFALTLLVFRSNEPETTTAASRNSQQIVIPQVQPPDAESLAQVELAQAHIKQRKWADAVTALAPALAKSPTLKDDERVASILSEAVRHNVSASAAFALLQGPMEIKGSEIIYDLAAALDTPQPLRAMAEKWLASEAFSKNSPAPLAIAGELRAARTCKEKHALLPQAGALGDERALAYLKILASPSGCGSRARNDCYPCLRADSALKNAISAIESRLNR